MPIFETGRKVLALVRTDKRLNAFIQGGAINSFSVPKEITHVAPHAFDNIRGLAEIVFANQDVVVEVDENAGIGAEVVFVVPSQLEAGYEAAYPERTIETYESGYQWTVPYVEGGTSTTLTAAYINQCVADMTTTQKAAVGRVVVPVYFTAYESGAIAKIQNTFVNMTNLITCYEAGNIDLDMNGDIVAKIVSIGKTVDEALVYSKLREASWAKPASAQNLPVSDDDVIYPPLDMSNTTISASSLNILSSKANLVAAYLPNFRYLDDGWGLRLFNGDANLVYASVSFALQPTSMSTSFSNCSSLKGLLLANLQISVNISASTLFTRQALVDLINSLGTPAETKTLTIGATNLAKLTADDIAIATAKNWTIQ